MASESEHSTTYIRRREEQVILEQVDLVGGDGASRAVLLYGAGGVGKTRLVRGMAESSSTRDDSIWVTPIDVDDSTYWLLANLEQAIANTLDPQRMYFKDYFDYLSRLPRYTHRHVGPETIITHLGRIKEIFIDCYRSFVTEPGRTVIITLDTVEAIRSKYLLLTITQWIKALPRTLFILAGRPPTGRPGQDPIREQLGGPLNKLGWQGCVELNLGGFDEEEGRQFLDESPLAASLNAAQRQRLLDLTERHPLWLALSVDFLSKADPPPEMTPRGTPNPQEREAFRRRLITPYRSSAFWPEAIKRLAVVRHGVDRHVWQRLMHDRELPPGVADWDQAWALLLDQPWVRPRANQRWVTLHDALAEELAQRVIPLHDQDGSWRSQQWRKAADIYAELTTDPDQRVQQERERLTGEIQLPGSHDDAALIQRVAELDAENRELNQLRTAQLHYSLLIDFQTGSDTFLELHKQARARHDLLFQELLCHEMERFLPHEGTQAPLEDVLGTVVDRFHDWLRQQAPVRHVEIVLSIAGFLIQNEQPSSALDLLNSLPQELPGEPLLRYRLDNQRGNAAMRLPGHIGEARKYFGQALEQAHRLDSPRRERREAQARKELGFYYRNLGHWQEADLAYQSARDVMTTILGPGTPDEDREEMASIQTNWAYVKALQGKYQEARNLVESAIAVRRRLGRPLRVGVSLSVSGEVFRFGNFFVRAWQSYEEAESIFQDLKSWPWLGSVYQEQAICLHQAQRAGVPLLNEQQKQAHVLIRRAVDICRDLAIRSYPSALNRAGRIIGAEDVDEGLKYLERSIAEAKKIADGRVLSGSLVVYLDMCYRTWRKTGEQGYRNRITNRLSETEQALGDYDFLDLRGRWELLQGHLTVWDATGAKRLEKLDEAVWHYSRGFARLADERVGSYGAGLIAREFETFREMFTTLPNEVQSDWYSKLRSDWSRPDPGGRSTALLARLEELY